MFAGHVNRECEKNRLNSITQEQFECLIIIAGFKSTTHTDVRTRFLSKLEQEKDITLKAVTTESNNLVSIKRDTMSFKIFKKSENLSITTRVNNVMVKKMLSQNRHCGDGNYARFCPLKKPKNGHEERFFNPNSHKNST